MLSSTPHFLYNFNQSLVYWFLLYFGIFLLPLLRSVYFENWKKDAPASEEQVWLFRSSKTSIWDTFVFRRSPSSTSSTLAPSPKHRILDFFDEKWVIFDGNLCFLRMISLFGWNAHMLCAFWPGCHYSAHTPDRIPPTRPASQPCRPCQPCQLFHCIQPFLWP